MARLRIGREEFFQRLLTSLIVGGRYPRWNSRNVPSPRGVRYLTLLDELAFGEAGRDVPTFVDELDLPRRHDGERGCAPDQAVLWPDRLWMIELKTERDSHRRDQLSSYFEYGRHHFPGVELDLLYVTPPMESAAPITPEGARFAHLTWYEVSPLIVSVWGDSNDEMERRIAGRLAAEIRGLVTPASDWRAQPSEASTASPPWPPPLPPPQLRSGHRFGALDAALALAVDVEADGKQRALDFAGSGLDELLELRLQVRDALTAAGSPAPHVRPWIWRPESLGRPLTKAGWDTGYELRLSYYANP